MGMTRQVVLSREDLSLPSPRTHRSVGCQLSGGREHGVMIQFVFVVVLGPRVLAPLEGAYIALFIINLALVLLDVVQVRTRSCQSQPCCRGCLVVSK